VVFVSGVVKLRLFHHPPLFYWPYDQ